MYPRRARGQVQHVAAPKQRLGAIGVENRSRVDLRRHPERDAGREVGLDQSRDHIHRRALGCEHQVNADRPRHLGEPRDRFLHVAGIEHHEVRQLVDDDHDVGNGPLFRIFAKQAGSAVFLEELVVLIDVSHALFCQQLQPPFHLPDRVAQRIGRKLGFRDDRREQMGHAFVVPQFQPLRIHQDQTHLVGGGLVQNRHDEGIDRHRLASSG